jgi:hypothetical protein
MTGDKVTLNVMTPQVSVKCRKCTVHNETLGHIMGQCTYTKVQIIRRHDEIRDILTQKLAKLKEEVQIVEEATIQTAEGKILKPNLAVVSQGRVHVVDVTVRHEDTGYLEGYRSKIKKYIPLLGTLADKLEVKRGRVLPLVVVTRGCLPKNTIETLKALNISDKGTYTTIALTALRHSIEIYHAFIDYVPVRKTSLAGQGPNIVKSIRVYLLLPHKSYLHKHIFHIYT